MFPGSAHKSKVRLSSGPLAIFEINDSSLWKSSQGDSVCQCVQVRETYSQTISFRSYLVEQEEWLDSGKQRKKETLLISMSSKQKVIKM